MYTFACVVPVLQIRLTVNEWSETLHVHQINILTTTCYTDGGHCIIVPNHKLASTLIQNRSRSRPAVVRLKFRVAFDTSLETLETLRLAVQDWIRDRPHEWKLGPMNPFLFVEKSLVCAWT